LNGITRGNVIEICKRNGIAVFEKDFSLYEVYSADEAFVTGTFGGLGCVSTVDGRQIGDGSLGPLTRRLKSLYADLLDEECPIGAGIPG
jgi:branched-chain amino acid aminotransferase